MLLIVFSYGDFMVVLVTGAAGFIGFHLCQRLLVQGFDVVGIDNINDYYDVNLKLARLDLLKQQARFRFYKLDLAHQLSMDDLFLQHRFQYVVHLGAQAGVRYSIENPRTYIDSNVMGFVNVLEGCRAQKIEHLVFASTSSVYGANGKEPFNESDHTDHPMALYAATKKANELMAHSYASLFQLPSTGLRFFTVYGPWGRPDMALFKFTANILAGKPIDVYNHGQMMRDFTYVDDVVEGIMRVMIKPAQPNPVWDKMQPDVASSYAPYRIYNVGNHDPVQLMDYIRAIEDALGQTAIINYMPMQLGDIPSSCADVARLEHEFGFRPQVSVKAGVENFVRWYRGYYQK